MRRKLMTWCWILFMTWPVGTFAVAVPEELPDPDGREADMSKPVQVFILLGQSNMLGAGKISGGDGSLENAVKNKGAYPYLVDDSGDWTTRKDVRNVRVMQKGSNMQLFNNEWMTITGGKIGPEFGIGHYMGHVIDAPVLILKSCIGNRSLGWDLLPPGSPPYEHDGKTLPGYRGTEADPQGNGEKPAAGWYAGKQYDDDIANAKKVLEDLDKYYPGAKDYEVAGFFFWQGDKDRYNAAHAARYEENLVRFIKQLREDFNAPDAKFVCATLGQTTKGSGGKEGQIIDGQLAVDGESGKYPEFKGNVATVYSNPLSEGGSSNGHYNGNAETYMNVGEGMGKAMAELLGQGGGAPTRVPGLGPTTTPRGLRVWTDQQGRRIQAFLHRVEGNQVQLRSLNGRIITVPRDKLSAADQAVIDLGR